MANSANFSDVLVIRIIRGAVPIRSTRRADAHGPGNRIKEENISNEGAKMAEVRASIGAKKRDARPFNGRAPSGRGFLFFLDSGLDDYRFRFPGSARALMDIELLLFKAPE